MEEYETQYGVVATVKTTTQASLFHTHTHTQFISQANVAMQPQLEQNLLLPTHLLKTISFLLKTFCILESTSVPVRISVGCVEWFANCWQRKRQTK